MFLHREGSFPKSPSSFNWTLTRLSQKCAFREWKNLLELVLSRKTDFYDGTYRARRGLGTTEEKLEDHKGGG